MSPRIGVSQTVCSTHAVRNEEVNFSEKSSHQVDDQRSLFAHPKADAQALQRQIAERLGDCLTNNKPMVSFHSPGGFQKCRSLCDPKITAPNKDPQRPSLLQYCIEAQHLGKPIQIEIEDQVYTVEIELNNVKFNEGGPNPTDCVKHMKGKLLLKPQNSSEKTKTIHFVEMSPPFDGYALSADDLIKCAGQMALIRQENQKYSGFKGQFSSANGICRSASLLVVDQFSEFLAKENSLNQDFDVTKKVNSLISHLRSGRQDLIPHSTQVDAIHAACTRLFNRNQQNKTNQEQTEPLEESDAQKVSVPFSSSAPVNEVKNAIPNLQPVRSDETLEGESGNEVDTENEVDERKPAAVAGFDASTNQEITFDQNFWGWGLMSQEDLDLLKNRFFKSTQQEKDKTIAELRSAIEWLTKIFSFEEIPDWLNQELMNRFNDLIVAIMNSHQSAKKIYDALNEMRLKGLTLSINYRHSLHNSKSS